MQGMFVAVNQGRDVSVDHYFPDQFKSGGIEFKQDRTGAGNKVQHSAPRHCQQYLRDTRNQGMRQAMHNVVLYSVGDYVRHYREACVKAFKAVRHGEEKMVVTDSNGKLWTIIILRSGNQTAIVKHAHLENYQSD